MVWVRRAGWSTAMLALGLGACADDVSEPADGGSSSSTEVGSSSATNPTTTMADTSSSSGTETLTTADSSESTTAPSTETNTDSSSGETTTDSSSSGDSSSSSESSTGAAIVCGNGIIEAGEDCDDTGESALCDVDCTTVACGDGSINVTAAEECDAADAIDGDGCDADCTLTRAIAVATGGQHTCVLLDTGTVRCWGSGMQGQLGLSSTATIGDDELPSSVGTLMLGAAAAAVGGGYYHSCALLEAGDVRCWGDATYAQLGYGNTIIVGDDEPPSAAGPLALGDSVVQLATGYFHSCAVLPTQEVRCWGAGSDGQLGYGNTSHIGDDELPDSVGPVDVGGLVTRVTAGFLHTCALLEGGEVRCWGSSPDGQAGHGDTDIIGDDEAPSAANPVDIGAVALDVVAGGRHTCALLEGGEVRCWGVGIAGQLGNGFPDAIGDDEVPSSIPVVDVGGTVVQLAGGFFHTCALLDTGEVRCWGFNELGELGLGDVANIGDDEPPSAVDPIELGGIAVQVASSNDHSCALLDGGTVRCWGLGGSGQLGYGSTDNVGDDETPADVGDVPFF